MVDLKYDVLTAITVLSEVGCNHEAKLLAKKNKHYRDYLLILIKKEGEYHEAVKYIKYFCKTNRIES